MVSWPYSETGIWTGVNHDMIFYSWSWFFTLAARTTRARPPHVMYATQRDRGRKNEVHRVDWGDLRTPYIHDHLTMDTHPAPANLLSVAPRAGESRKIMISLSMVSAYLHHRLD